LIGSPRAIRDGGCGRGRGPRFCFTRNARSGVLALRSGQDGPKQWWGRFISVTLYQYGSTFYGEGKWYLEGQEGNC
jgi:hypothetical protein